MTNATHGEISIDRARPADATELTRTQVRSFHDDSRRFNDSTGHRPGGPPGHDSVDWQLRMMRLGHYFAIRLEGRIIGGMIAFEQAGHVCNLGRIWLDPEAQGLGIGRLAIEFMHGAFPRARTWTLETPAWAVRNHHLYESLGYRKIGEQQCPDGFVEYLYERALGNAPASPGEKHAAASD